MLLGSAAVALTACSGGAVSKGGVLARTASTTLKPISIRRGKGTPRFAASRSIQSVATQPGPGGYSFQTSTDGYVNLYKPDGSWCAQTDTSRCTDDAFVLMLTGVDGSQSTASVPTPWDLAADTTYNGSITGSGSGSPVPYQMRYDTPTRTSTITLGPNAWWKVAASGQQGREQYTYTDSAGATYQIPTAVVAAMAERRAPSQVAGGGGPSPVPTAIGTQGPCTPEKYAQCDQWRTLIWSTWALALVAISLAFIGCIGLLAWWTIGAGTAICAGLLAIALAAFTAMVFSTRSQFLLSCSNCQLSV
jgi:hypothetical protein